MRIAQVSRKTNETEVDVKLEIDGTGKRDISTGIGFLNHMIELFAKQGMFDITLSCKGDLNVDTHHTIEDIGIALGQSFRKAIGEKIGIKRYGQRLLPMDEALCLCAVDFCGRPYLIFNADFKDERINDFPTQCVYDFFYSFAVNAGMNIAFKMMEGRNDHHKIEAMFKAFARALREACEFDKRAIDDIPSTKGVLGEKAQGEKDGYSYN